MSDALNDHGRTARKYEDSFMSGEFKADDVEAE